MPQKIRVLLIQGNARQVLPMAKSLKELGCHVTTFNNSKLDPGYASKYPDKRIISYCEETDPEGSFSAIKKELECGAYDLVIPMNDYAAILLSEKKEQLAKLTTIAVNNWDVFKLAMDKLKTMEVCMKNHIPCPKTFFSMEDFLKVSDSIAYPVVVKPRTGCAAVGFHVSDNKDDVISYYKNATAKYGPCLIQEYIPQTDLQYKAELYVDRKGTLKAACVFAKVRWYPISGGSSCLNVTVDRPDIIDSCARLLEKINWRGYADIDLIQDPRDGVAKIMEINPRITGSVKICFKAGINFSKLILQDVRGEEVEESFSVRYNTCLRYMHTDILWFLKSKNRFKSQPSWFSFKNCSDQIFSWDDPWPFVTFTLQGVKKLYKDKKRRTV